MDEANRPKISSAMPQYVSASSPRLERDDGGGSIFG